MYPIKDKYLEGLRELEKKRKKKEAGSVTFHINQDGVVPKVKIEKIIK